MKKALSLWLSIALIVIMLPVASVQAAKYLPYDMVGDFSEGLAWYVSYDEESDVERFGFLNTSGKVVIAAKYDWVGGFHDGLAAFELNGKMGMIDKTGKEIIKPVYDVIDEQFMDGLLAVAQGEKWGYINKEGKFVIEATYDGATRFGNGIALVVVNDGYSFIDTTGKQVFEANYDDAFEFIEGYSVVASGEKWGFIDTTGKELVAPKYDEAYAFQEGLAPVRTGNLWGFIDKTGNEVVKPQYEDVYGFSEGFAAVMKNGLWGFIDKNGKEVIKPKYADVLSDFSEGLVLVSKYDKEQTPMQGYIDATGKEVTKFDYDFTGGAFEGGYAAVSDGGFGTYYIMKNPLLAPVSAKPTASKVMVNGKAVSFEAYNIGGSNYFKLRDLALAVNGTDKNFEVGFDKAKNAVNLLANKAYTPVGGELVASGGQTGKSAAPSVSKIYVDGVQAPLKAYNIGGNNYFKLRDIAKAFNIGITFDASTSTIGIDTSLSYTE
ncbi:WG repeat-containing protein [Paenibacillus harenae]|uniref:Copper amine oxidase-like N-terminal domain-containing protein n=1 Tax=Paenibacillus harenae TaxID=306543 RepID=A0ABT9UAA6_PAEHA|nr:WG repeat-containing protein [Paenibacillus harenae]MDQ0116578.1 hypothetical protein [Paenibacillus harenae]